MKKKILTQQFSFFTSSEQNENIEAFFFSLMHIHGGQYQTNKKKN
jgi:hypothetical protein